MGGYRDLGFIRMLIVHVLLVPVDGGVFPNSTSAEIRSTVLYSEGALEGGSGLGLGVGTF